MLKNKIIASVAAVLTATSLFSVCSSATGTADNNNITVSSCSVEKTFVSKSGKVIPAGSTAISLNIANNAGMIASEFQIEVDGATAITDDYGYVVIENDGQSDYAASQRDDTIYVAGISAAADTRDGTLFTMYFQSKPQNITLSDSDLYENHMALNSAMSKKTGATKDGLTDYYVYVGDLNADNNINVGDAQLLLNSVSIAHTNGWSNSTGTAVPDSVYGSHLSTLLPGITLINTTYGLVVQAATADGNSDGYVTSDPDNTLSSDAHQLLQYYVCGLTHNPYTTPGFNWDARFYMWSM